MRTMAHGRTVGADVGGPMPRLYEFTWVSRTRVGDPLVCHSRRHIRNSESPHGMIRSSLRASAGAACGRGARAGERPRRAPAYLRLSPLTGPRLPAGQGAVRILVTTSGWTLLSMYDSYH